MRTGVAEATNEGLPEPSAELVLWRASMEAFIKTAGRKRSEKFLRALADRLAMEDNLSSVFSIRPNTEAGKVRVARKQAAEIFTRYLPIFLASIAME